MASVYYEPIHPAVRDVNTSQDVLGQILLQLNSLHLRQRPKAVQPFLAQARAYYADAMTSDWRSAGLLYYYSFLNLAKALLLFRHKFNVQTLHDTALHHGLSAGPQSPNEIIDFGIKIHPDNPSGRRSVFAVLYHALTGYAWPFPSQTEPPRVFRRLFCVSQATRVAARDCASQ